MPVGVELEQRLEAGRTTRTSSGERSATNTCEGQVIPVEPQLGLTAARRATRRPASTAPSESLRPPAERSSAPSRSEPDRNDARPVSMLISRAERLNETNPRRASGARERQL